MENTARLNFDAVTELRSVGFFAFRGKCIERAFTSEVTTLKKRVLVVDDEPGVGRVLRIRLRLSGYDVITTTNGGEAVEIVRTQRPDIVLLDVVMGEVSGLDVLDRVRNFSQVPVIIFTGHPEITHLASELGANDFIAKPFDPDILIRKIELALGTGRASKGSDEDQGQGSCS